MARDRDQLFAEAVQLYRQGVQWWPDQNFEKEHIRPEQDARFEDDAWEQAVCSYVADKKTTTILNIARDGLFIDTGKVGTADQRRIIAILEREGWQRGKKTETGIPWLAPVVAGPI